MTTPLTLLLEDAQPRPTTTLAEANHLWRAIRVKHGFAATNPPLLSPPKANHKLELGLAAGAVAYGLSLAPADESGVNTCTGSTRACRRNCLSKAGNGRYDSNTRARICKTAFLAEHPEAFLTLLVAELIKARAKHGAALSVRLNVFSDLRWERIAPWIFEQFADVQFYDYSKLWGRVRTLPANYWLTYSVSERTSVAGAAQRVAMGCNIAVVFGASRAQPLPTEWHGLRVIDGDLSDARHLDPRGVVVGLRAKGSMRRDHLGMVRG